MRFSTISITAMMVVMASAIDTITVKDRHFYTSSGEAFFVKGVDYQPGGSAAVGKAKSDPLSDIDACNRDIALFKDLGLNTIRVYSIDTTLNHDACMSALAAAGIYLVLDVNSPLPNQHLNSMVPWTTYNEFYLEHIFTVMEQFAGYDNVMAFLAGNEVVHTKGSELTSPQYIKAVIRDMRAYSTKHLKRQIPIGYSNADSIEFRVSLAKFLECGEEGYVDFWGVNSYQWCGVSGFENSGYDKLVEDYMEFSKPIFFSEYGCNEVRPRPWQEVGALYSDKMTHVFSGGLVYEFTQETADYGIVQLDKEGNVATLPEYNTLKDAFSKTGTPKIPSNVKTVSRPETCGKLSDYPGITANNTLPATLGAKFIEDGVDKSKFKIGALQSNVQTGTKYKTSAAAAASPVTPPGASTTRKSAAGRTTIAIGAVSAFAAMLGFALVL